MLIAGPSLLVWWHISRAVGPRHTFNVGSGPQSLAEEVVLGKAREALALDGYDGDWQPVKHQPRRTDYEYLLFNGSGGYVAFVKSSAKRTQPCRMVQLEFKDGVLSCWVLNQPDPIPQR